MAGSSEQCRTLLLLLCSGVCMWCSFFPLCLSKDVSQHPSLPVEHRLYEVLHRFETLRSDQLELSQVWEGMAQPSQNLRQVLFKAHGRNFRLLLSVRQDLFHRQAQALVRGANDTLQQRPIPYDQFYTGRVFGEIQSHVSAHLHPSTGVLTATVAIGDETYYVEPSHWHVKGSHDFHMITYRQSDLKRKLASSDSTHFCGTPHHTSHPSLSGAEGHGGYEGGEGEGEREGEGEGEGEGRQEVVIAKRQSSGEKRICDIELEATHQFHQIYGNGDVDNTIQFIIHIISSVDSIYSRTVWSEELTNFGLIIRNITVYDSDSNDPSYNQDTEWKSGLLLERFSEVERRGCLGHLFTAAPLSDGLLGLAYIADVKPTNPGGICSDFINIDGQKRSTNVAFSSYLLHGQPLLLAEGIIVTAHEIGHNWGANHDPPDDKVCSPPFSNTGGKFLMYPYATDGSQPNNNIFSNCSKDGIAQVLEGRSGCFLEPESAACGNYIVDMGEDCDPGLLNDDPCCSSDCKFIGNAACSDINSPCCENCQAGHVGRVCQEFSDGNLQCQANRTCQEGMFDCPNKMIFAPENTSCGAGGVCLKSSGDVLSCSTFCELRNMITCYCGDENECNFCCKDGSDGECMVYLDSGTTMVLPLPTGTSCNGGTCSKGSCVLTSPDLSERLFDVISNFSVNVLWIFIRENIVGAVLFFTLLVWIPVSTLVWCMDKRAWKRHKEEAEDSELRKLYLEEEDDCDFNCNFLPESLKESAAFFPQQQQQQQQQRRLGSIKKGSSFDFFDGHNGEDPWIDHHDPAAPTSVVGGGGGGGGAEGKTSSVTCRTNTQPPLERGLSTISERSFEDVSEEYNTEKNNIWTLSQKLNASGINLKLGQEAAQAKAVAAQAKAVAAQGE